MTRQTKGAAILALLQRPGGATNKEMMEATGWQTHTVRGFLAGPQLRRMGFMVQGGIREDGERAYIAKALPAEEGA